ncbi:MAG: exodeoxyribonuclease VII large subunit [Saprospiraceae bacterium]
MEKTDRYTLFELNEYIRRVMALNFSEALWISCELAQVSESRGHMYLSLVQKEEGDTVIGDGEGKIIAQSEAVIWATDHRRLKRKLGSQFTQILQAGLEVLISVQVDFHERYGLKLIIKDIDPAFTIGKLELRRQETLQHLKKKGLLEKNKQRNLPPVLQRIAVISSERAAGFQDFQKQLVDNPYGYFIDFILLNAAMQGDNVKSEVIQRLEEINQNESYFDCAVIIRGGGAKLDLVAFDDADLCTAIANCKIPVVTGIGHDIDETISDLVAFYSLKTPTAVAEWIIQGNLYFEMEVLENGRAIKMLSQRLISEQYLEVERISQVLKLSAKSQLQNQNRLLDYIEEELPRNSSKHLKNENKLLHHLETILDLLNPEKVLQRGFSMTLKDGKPVTNAKDLKPDDLIASVFADGRVKSKVIKD